MKKITILHVFSDTQFFDVVSDFFDKLANIENIYAIYARSSKYRYKYIGKTNKIKLYTDYQDYTSLFHSDAVDIIYFHSLSPLFYRYFKYIGKDKKVIWWCWGYDIYSGLFMSKPFVPIEAYKPITKAYRNKVNRRQVFKNILRFLLTPYSYYVRKRIIKRIDYFSPVIPIEYDLMNKFCKGFRAKPFMLKAGPGLVQKDKLSYRLDSQNILVGNSLSWENNLPDVFEYLHKITLACNRKYIIPISYGNRYGGQNKIKKLADLNPNQVIWLEKFMPKEDYFNMFNNISHAIFGTLRQHSMSNISYCLRNGIKIFLFKDSIVYKFFKDIGYAVFNIEDDLNDYTISEPLTPEEAELNYDIFYGIHDNKVHKAEIELYNMIDEY